MASTEGKDPRWAVLATVLLFIFLASIVGSGVVWILIYIWTEIMEMVK